MRSSENRESVRICCELNCAVALGGRKPEPESNPALSLAKMAIEIRRQIGAAATEFHQYHDQLADRTLGNALRTMQEQIDWLCSLQALALCAQQVWQLPLAKRALSLSMDGIGIPIQMQEVQGIELTPDESPNLLLQLPDQPPVLAGVEIATWQAPTELDSGYLSGRFAAISDTDLRRLRRFVLLRSR